MKISFSKDEQDVNVGDTFDVTVEVQNAKDVISAPFIFQFDPKLISVSDVAAGKFWSTDGQTPAPLMKNVQNESGLASIRVTRKPGTPAVAGSGTLLTLTLKALKSGTVTFSANNILLNNSQEQVMGSGRPTLIIHIK